MFSFLIAVKFIQEWLMVNHGHIIYVILEVNLYLSYFRQVEPRVAGVIITIVMNNHIFFTHGSY